MKLDVQAVLRLTINGQLYEVQVIEIGREVHLRKDGSTEWYQVTVGEPFCTCKGQQGRYRTCKHLPALRKVGLLVAEHGE